MSEEKLVEERPQGDAEPAAESGALREALRRARSCEADRAEVIVDLREAEIARLEMLRDAVEEVFREIPQDNDLLEAALIPGNPPRLWIDVLAHVAMARDKRTYRFVKDSRYGRQTILESGDVATMAAAITDYVAHRLLERARALEHDAVAAATVANPPPAVSQTPPNATGPRWGIILAVFLLGMITGAALLVTAGLILLRA